MRPPLLAALLLTSLALRAAPAQVGAVVPGWGVDTVAATGWGRRAGSEAVPEIFRAWRTYLLTAAGRPGPTPHWSAAEQRAWPMYDLTGSVAYQGFPATVLDIRPAREGATDEYVVQTLFAMAVGATHSVRPLALTRVYAVREEGRWVFANVLPRHTRDWPRDRVGPITYIVHPAWTFDRSRAEGAVRFADSVAALLEVPPLPPLTYVVTGSPEAMYGAMGVDWTVGGTGGWAAAANRMIFTGDPRMGEAYLHELVHVVAAPLTKPGRAHRLMVEGVATWLGGSLGDDYPTLVRRYAAYLHERPEVTLARVLEGGEEDVGERPAGAVLMAMAHERGGTAAVRTLLDTGTETEALRAALERVLGLPWAEVEVAWRARIDMLGATHQ